MTWVHEAIRQSPEILLFLSLAIGFWIGKFQFGRFQLGGVAGSLLVAVLFSQLGVSIDNGVKAVLFALFIYAVGFESGPQFFKSLGRQSLKEIAMAAVLAITGLVTVIVLARMFDLDKGLAAGVAAGGLTQSAIIGTAGSALAKLGLPPDELQRLQANVAIGYAVTYIFGSFGAIIICVNVLPKFMGRDIREDAVKAETSMSAGMIVPGAGEQLAAPEVVGRLYRAGPAAGSTVREIEALAPDGMAVTVERIKRDGQIIPAQADLKLHAGDIVLLAGRRAAVVAARQALGDEVLSSSGMDMVMLTRDVLITGADYLGKTVAQIRAGIAADIRHGIVVLGLKRDGRPLPMEPDTVIRAGDVAVLFGTGNDIQRAAHSVGTVIVPSDKTDWVYHGLGLALGLIIGLAVLRIGSIPLTLGSGGGALLSGLLFGWYRTRRMSLGNMPTGASTLLRDLGLAGFVAVVGLQSGLQAVETIRASGLSIFLIGVAVTIVPLLVTMLFGRYVLRYDNAAVFAGALSGSRSANPAFGEVLDKAGNSVPTVPFAVTYALANVFLTLLGPLVVAFA
ncbi:aspartate-alanine antiporter [Pigmentiphaga sp.]|uniref:aspartate-alanine antiporter n=1 Tax=Pigmentiphaga sp. TaxID=1977564 RepID=UPI00128C1EC5|nr:aspartate-alanine antiporter [Pigmentiphaga sp.]MPS28657.1 aspartate-alanine antiporter [Alcaligenaceae bacterium SAGV5]MPS52402.1 aspartate-alanine antiporter [Alcaligenaceae bacterium SAGV3]MPT58127.1 aspartate-alanine antiporter [Alcaligenaceae bacterium]